MAVKDITFNNKIFKINYEILNPSCGKDIVFLHGWGSNKDIMKQAFGKYLSDFRHIYIDMPGFGKSSNEYVLTTKDYAGIIKEFNTKFKIQNSKLTIAGHSFGGKVATLLNPKNLVLLSSAGIVEQKPFSVKAKIKLFKLLKPFGADRLYRFFATKDVNNLPRNMYETLKNVVDEDFTDEFKNYSGKALIFWGNKDSATSLQSGKKIAQLIKNSEFYEYDGDHYFFIQNSKNITKAITKAINGNI